MESSWQHTASAATCLILACFVSGSLPSVFAQYGSPVATGSSSGATFAHAYSSLAPNATNAGCVAFPLNISRHGYCREVKYMISAAIDPRLADRTANDSYQNDRALWQPALDCSLQIPGQSICSNCLAIRHKWHCASQFATCTGTGSGFATAGPCQWLCQEKNTRCSEDEDCSQYPTEACSAATLINFSVWELIGVLTIGALLMPFL